MLNPNLAALYHEVQFWLTLRATRDYLKEETWDTYHVRRLPSVVWELKKQAAEDDLVERTKHDIKRIQKRCRQIALEHNQRAKKKKMRRPVKMKTFRTQLREIDSFREDRNDNQNLIDKENGKHFSRFCLELLYLLSLECSEIRFEYSKKCTKRLKHQAM